MRNVVRSGMPSWVLALGALPAALGVVVVLLQAGELTAPSVQQCQVSGLASCLSELPHQRSTALLYGWIGVILLLGVGIGLALLAVLPSSGTASERPDGAEQRRASAGVFDQSERRELGRGAASAARASDRGQVDQNGSVVRDRALLVQTCVELSDLVSSGALRERLTDALADVGVTPIQVGAGAMFDSSRHHAVGELRTADTARHNLVAETERVGWVDHGRRLRYPDVVVFTAEGQRNHDK